MAGYIPRNFINDLLARTDIIELIDARVKLKKRGKNFLACCPFHQEKTPSFNVNPNKQFFHCFGCGESGNAIDFLMKYERLDFIETIEELAASLSLEVPYEKRSNNQTQISHHQRQDYYLLMDKISDFYQNSLSEQHGINARTYLEKRGLSHSIISRFCIGYSPRNHLIKKFNQDDKTKKTLVELGMFGVGDNGSLYDRFRERVMFPIRDKRGRVLGFGGRVIDDSLPKYLNSPETELFHKSRQLYGLYELLQDSTEPKNILIVEGYMDVVALAQFDVKNAVAALGTATTTEHIQLLFRHTEQIVCCYDGDRAGRAAAWRALQAALPYLEDGREVNFIFLPDGEDPDSIIRKLGKDVFLEMVEQAEPFSTLMFDTLMKEADIGTSQGKTKLSSLAIPLILQVPGFTHQLFLKKILGNKLGIIAENQLEQLFFQYKQKTKQELSRANLSVHRGGGSTINTSQHSTQSVNQAEHSIKSEVTNKHLHTVIGLLIQNPNLATLIPSVDGFLESKIAGTELLIELFKTCEKQPNMNMAQLIQYYRSLKLNIEESEDILQSQKLSTKQLDKIINMLSKYAVWEHAIELDNIKSVFIDSLSGFYDYLLRLRLESLILKARSNGNLTSEEQEEVKALTSALSNNK